MKYEHQIKTGEFEYIKELFEGTPEEAVAAHRALQAAWKGGTGLPDKEFDKFVENQLGGSSNHTEEWEKMSPEQKKYIQINKRALNRLEAKNNKI